jgi:hypothetical protein
MSIRYVISVEVTDEQKTYKINDWVTEICDSVVGWSWDLEKTLSVTFLDYDEAVLFAIKWGGNNVISN